MKRLCVAVVAALAVFTPVTVAYAQTTTTLPCGSGTGRDCGFDRQQDLGILREGQTFQITNNCDFAGNVTKTFNGSPIGTGVGPCPVTEGKILDDGIGPVQNTLGRVRPLFAAAGLHLAQANRTPRVVIDGTTYNANAIGVRNAIVVQGTATDTGPGKWTNFFTIAGPAGSSVAGNSDVAGNGLGRTGVMIVRWSLLGAALIAVGALLVLSGRRRRTV
jgi:hypothetical protein